MNERILRLEEKVAYLERHVTAQDKAMLEIADELAALRREVKGMRERVRGGSINGDEGAEDATQRPPHY